MSNDYDFVGWFAGDIPPVRSGFYRVRNLPGATSKFIHLNAAQHRYWDQKKQKWAMWNGGPMSVMGDKNHEWCGLTKECHDALRKCHE